jgi:hypothetical protein
MPEIEVNDELKEAVRQVLAEILLGGSVPSYAPTREYYPTSEAWKLLGYKNVGQLYDAVKAKLLRIGIEVEDRRIPDAQLPKYFFHIEKCKKRLSTPPEKRK